MRNLETVSPKTVELLSRIVGQKLDAKDVTPPVIFLAALISVLLGVMFADAKVTAEEKQRWQKTLNRFIPAEGNIRQLAQLLSKGIREQKTYANSDELLTLMMSLSESEKLLLIGFGYEMSAADGAIDESEKHHLRQIANLLKLKPSYLDVLEAGFIQQSVLDLAALKEVKSLLDPARFHELDTLFVKAANDLLSTLPTTTEEKSPESKVASFDRLKEFQTSRNRLDGLCNQLHEIIQLCSERSFLPNHFVEDVAEISCKLKSQRFRVAVVGEFSQGKSTLLNALLGEEVQPVRAVPCSGTITTLRHGDRKKVICHYKDGRQEEISVDEYKEKASIQKVSVVEQDSDKFAASEIEEIIFEHPDLDLCKSGVEILDSPGLNENPDRTAITEKLLKDIDAAIFLTNAARLLPESEKELIQDVRTQLTGSANGSPADNLFVLVNFMDLLDNEQDLQDVTQRLEEFIEDENLIVANKNRVHYISAKAALKGQSEYLKSFREFTRAIEHFLTVERGSIKTKRIITKLRSLIQKSLDQLKQTEDILNGENERPRRKRTGYQTALFVSDTYAPRGGESTLYEIELSASEKRKILEQIGEASGREVKIRDLSKQLRRQTSQQSTEAWNVWRKGLRDRITKKSEGWYSDHNPVLSQKLLIESYTRQFTQNFSQEIDGWTRNQLGETILKPNLSRLDAAINQELSAIQAEMKNLDGQVKTALSSQLNISIEGISDDFVGAGGVLGGIGMGGALSVALLLLTPVGIVGLIGAGMAAAIAGTFGLGMLDVDGLRDKIKQKVLKEGFEKFETSRGKACEKLSETINIAFKHRTESASRVIAEAILLYENLLEQQENVHQKNVEQRKTEKAWISQKRLELEDLRFNVKGIFQYSGQFFESKIEFLDKNYPSL